MCDVAHETSSKSVSWLLPLLIEFYYFKPAFVFITASLKRTMTDVPSNVGKIKARVHLNLGLMQISRLPF